MADLSKHKCGLVFDMVAIDALSLAVEMTILALKKRLAKIEKELEKSRGTVQEDGWQTQRFARKSRKWDVLAQEKMKIIQRLNDGKD